MYLLASTNGGETIGIALTTTPPAHSHRRLTVGDRSSRDLCEIKSNFVYAKPAKLEQWMELDSPLFRIAGNQPVHLVDTSVPSSSGTVRLEDEGQD